MAAPRLDPEISAQWARIRGRLRAEVGDASYRSWLKPLTLVSVADGAARIAVPTRFMRDWVVSHYGDRLRELWCAEDESVETTDIFVQAPVTRPVIRPAGMAAPKETNGSGASAVSGPVSGAADQAVDISAISAPLDSRFSFEQFVVGKANELAYAAARRVADSEVAPFNPLFLYGAGWARPI